MPTVAREISFPLQHLLPMRATMGRIVVIKVQVDCATNRMTVVMDTNVDAQVDIGAAPDVEAPQGDAAWRRLAISTTMCPRKDWCGADAWKAAILAVAILAVVTVHLRLHQQQWPTRACSSLPRLRRLPRRLPLRLHHLHPHLSLLWLPRPCPLPLTHAFVKPTSATLRTACACTTLLIHLIPDTRLMNTATLITASARLAT